MSGNDPENASHAELSSVRRLIEETRMEFRDAIDSIKTEYNANLDEKDSQLNKLRAENTNLSRRLDEAELRIEKQGVLIDDLEQASNRKFVKLYGIEISDGEDSKDIRQIVKGEATRMRVPIKAADIVRAHRTCTPYIDENKEVQQPVLVEFNSSWSRDEFYSIRDDSQFDIQVVLTERREEVLRYAREQVIKSSSKYFDAVFADQNCDLVAVTSTGRQITFNTKEEFDGLLQDIQTDYIFDAIGDDFDTLYND